MTPSLEQSLNSFSAPFNSIGGYGLVAVCVLVLFAIVVARRVFLVTRRVPRQDMTGSAVALFCLLLFAGIGFVGSVSEIQWRKDLVDRTKRILSTPAWTLDGAVMRDNQVTEITLRSPEQFAPITILGKTTLAQVPGEIVTLKGAVLKPLLSNPELSAVLQGSTLTVVER